MSDHDLKPDPVDQAYLAAEALLDDEAARAARRERVLVAASMSTPSLAPSSRPWTSRAPFIGRNGRWLAAAGIVGLSVGLATQLMPPLANRAASPPTAATRSSDAAAAPPAAGDSSRAALASAPLAQAKEAATSSSVGIPIPQAVRAPALAATPAAAMPLSVPPSVPSSFAPSPAALPPPPPPPAPAPAPPPPPVVAAPASLPAMRRGATDSASLVSAAQRLTIAAARGKLAEVESLLSTGVSVDATDGAGNTALMRSLQGNHRDVAALLVQRGASLDAKNQEGLSARAMLAARNDPELSAALGVTP